MNIIVPGQIKSLLDWGFVLDLVKLEPCHNKTNSNLELPLLKNSVLSKFFISLHDTVTLLPCNFIMKRQTGAPSVKGVTLINCYISLLEGSQQQTRGEISWNLKACVKWCAFQKNPKNHCQPQNVFSFSVSTSNLIVSKIVWTSKEFPPCLFKLGNWKLTVLLRDTQQYIHRVDIEIILIVHFPVKFKVKLTLQTPIWLMMVFPSGFRNENLIVVFVLSIITV